MKHIQFFLTVNEGKWMIAEAISQMADVRRALENGSVIFKGGTTVSCVSELITGIPLKISGRNTPFGAKSGKLPTTAPHTLLWKNKEAHNMDDCVDEAFLSLNPEDILIIGANLIDAEGNAAMLAGAPGGGSPGKAASAMASEGFKVIIAAGLEKLTPGKVNDAIRASSRKGMSSAYGMACGLFPVFGQLITEMEAIKQLADVKVDLIGRGGVQGAEGGTLFQISGEEKAVDIIEEVVTRCKGKGRAGDPSTWLECEVPSPGCKMHLSCRYRVRQ